ncbi:MAG: heme-binding protein [Planctomycetota bacterium]
MKNWLLVWACASAVVGATGCSVVGIRLYEQPEYEVLAEDGAVEIRQYETLVLVETDENGSISDTEESAFWRLFRYISGANDGARSVAMTAPVVQEPQPQKIEMTAPVLQSATDAGWRMAFVLPSEYTIETAPQPTDPGVRLREVRGARVAAIRYSGFRTDAKYASNTERLRDWLAQNQIEERSQPRYAGYDPPFTLWFLRRNEILIDVE